jgi:toxin ParE1/3/4
MHSVRIRRVASNDMDEIAAYIGQDNPGRAESFTDEISNKIATVAERPLSFRSRDDLMPGLRSALIGNYLILFLFGDDEVDIVRVVYGARDLESLF